jgi:hypothetical protein
MLKLSTVMVALVACILSVSLADEAVYDDQYQNNNNNADDYQGDDLGDDAYENGDDDGMEAYNNQYEYQQQGDDNIKYWTEYAILPKRCIV